jgi:hypothetical protein
VEKVKASRNNTMLRIANCGESNSGKTWAALMAAQIINGGNMNGVTLIDTENRGHLYEDHFSGYSVMKIMPPFDPEKLVEAINQCAKDGDKIVIVDSASDFWDRTNQIHKEIVGTNFKLSYYLWGKVTPRWDALRAAITNAPFHVITCWRMKDKLVKNDQGEMVVDGQRVVARGGSKGIKYDYHVAFIIDEHHRARVGKDNLNVFSDWKDPKVIDKEIVMRMKNWLDKGVKNVISKSNSDGKSGEGPRA